MARQLGASFEEILNGYETRISYRTGRSDVPETVAIDHIDNENWTKAAELSVLSMGGAAAMARGEISISQAI